MAIIIIVVISSSPFNTITNRTSSPNLLRKIISIRTYLRRTTINICNMVVVKIFQKVICTSTLFKVANSKYTIAINSILEMAVSIISMMASVLSEAIPIRLGMDASKQTVSSTHTALH